MSAKTSCKIQSLFLYPIKSARGFPVTEAVVDAWGLRLDREFMIVDRDGRFQTRRECPAMAGIETALAGGGLGVAAAGAGELRVRVLGREHAIPLGGAPGEGVQIGEGAATAAGAADGPGAGVAVGAAAGTRGGAGGADAPRALVRVWKSTVEADLVDCPELNADLSRLLGREVRLVRYGAHSRREVVKSGRAWGRQFRFADSANLLVTTEESLADLNRRLDAPVPMSRFRPNVVVAGDGAWAEDSWANLRTPEGLELTVVGGCGRCQIITQDPDTGELVSKEPLQKLAEFRRFGASVDFGVHAVHTLPDGDPAGGPVGAGTATLRVGMELQIEYKA